MTKKEKLINDILFVCKVNIVSSGKPMDMNAIFLNLIFKNESELIAIATELNIKT